jgi:hypothetical protein
MKTEEGNFQRIKVPLNLITLTLKSIFKKLRTSMLHKKKFNFSKWSTNDSQRYRNKQEMPILAQQVILYNLEIEIKTGHKSIKAQTKKKNLKVEEF